MKNSFLFIFIGLIFQFGQSQAAQTVPFSIQTQILPNTIYCIKGSDAHPVSYCADYTPCKTKVGPNSSHVVCLAGTSNPPAGALTIAQSCWSMTTEYTCMQFETECTQYTSNPKCTEQGTKQCTTGPTSQLMLSTNPKIGGCSAFTREFMCLDSTATTSTTSTLSCDTTSSMNGLDWTTNSPSASDDFVTAVTSQEFARQLGVYGNKDGMGNGLFPGTAQSCRDGYFGLKNCCKSNGGGAVSNASLGKKLGLAVGGFKIAAGYAADVGGRYVFDTVYNNAPSFMQDGVMSMFGASQGNSWMNAGVGMYGFGTTASSAAGTFAATSASTSIGSIGSMQIYFNPYALAAAVAIQVIMDVMSCTQAESDLASAKSMDLCHYVGNFCSNEVKFLGKTIACLETTQAYCCYNGLLAKAVEEGAHGQLGLSWGSPQGPACAGLTIAQLSALDFGTQAMKDAMKPFQKQVMESFNATTAPALTDGTIKADATAKATKNANALCLQRKKFDPSTVCN